MTAATWDLSGPEKPGLVPRETLHGDHDNGKEEVWEEVLIARATQSVQLPIDSRRPPFLLSMTYLPCLIGVDELSGNSG